MSLLRKNKMPAEPIRRRPVATGGDRPSKPGQAFSYYSQRSVAPGNTGRQSVASETEVTTARTERAERSGRTTLRQRLLRWLAVALLLVLGAYSLYLSPDPKVTLRTDQTTAYFLQDASVYHQTAASTLGSSPLNRVKLIASTDKVRLDLLQNYPEIQDVSVHLPLLAHRANVTIDPHRPSFVLTTTADTAFLLDSTGRALASSSQFSSDKLTVPTLHDKTGLEVSLGKRAVPSSTVSFATTVVNALKAGNAEPTTLTLSSAYELDVTAAGAPYTIKFNIQADPLQQSGTYLAVRGRLSDEHATPKEYVDVRVPGRAYYK
jgi:hypothetical protein